METTLAKMQIKGNMIIGFQELIFTNAQNVGVRLKKMEDVLI